MNVIPVGPEPATLTCPSCHATVITRLENVATTKTHIWAAVMCLFLCWPCAFLPYCLDSCRDAEHFCPSCGAYLGTYRR